MRLAFIEASLQQAGVAPAHVRFRKAADHATVNWQLAIQHALPPRRGMLCRRRLSGRQQACRSIHCCSTAAVAVPEEAPSWSTPVSTDGSPTITCMLALYCSALPCRPRGILRMSPSQHHDATQPYWALFCSALRCVVMAPHSCHHCNTVMHRNILSASGGMSSVIPPTPCVRGS